MRQLGMATSNEELAFNEALMSRVKQWREERGWTAERVAIALGIPPDRYRKYEYRTPLPPYLYQRLCFMYDVDLEHLLLGKPRARANPPRAVASKRG